MKLRSGKIKSLFNYDLIKHEDYIYLSVMDLRTKSLTPKFKEELYTEIRETFGYNLRVSMTEYFPEPETTISILNACLPHSPQHLGSNCCVAIIAILVLNKSS